MWTIIDNENAANHSGPPIIGEQFLIIGYFMTEELAVDWLDNYPDKAKVIRGGFGLDAPEGE